MNTFSIAIIGAGLAGAECSLCLARAGIAHTLFEMKPHQYTAAHSSPFCAELVCSNSFRSETPDSAVGILKREMQELASAVMETAQKCRVPAGKSLAVDRDLFSQNISSLLENNPYITVVRQEVQSLFSLSDKEGKPFTHIVLAAGPLMSDALAQDIQAFLGEQSLFFYDALAPIVDGSTIDYDKAFWAGRYESDAADYINCPLTEEEYYQFQKELVAAQKAPIRDFEENRYFEACMPIETLASRGDMTLAFGPLKPVGLVDLKTGQRPFAVLQLRAENLNKSMFNLVGCQTRLSYPEQKRIFRMIPALAKVEFIRFGSMHRNTFIDAPKLLTENFSLKKAPHIFLAGQLSGVEGYLESAASGLWIGLQLSALYHKKNLKRPPRESALGALLGHLITPTKNFQPSNVQFGLMPTLEQKAKKIVRKELYRQRAQDAFDKWKQESAL